MLVKLEDTVEHRGEPHRHRLLRLAIKAQSLLHDMADALQFILRDREISARGCVEVGMFREQIEHVRHRLERVVDLVRDGRGEPSHCSHTLGIAQQYFRTLLVGNVEGDTDDAVRLPCFRAHD